MTLKALRKERTLLERWSESSHVSKTLWDKRARRVAEFIAPGSRVLDIGCGGMTLEQFLPDGCVYIPLDVAKRDDRTVVVDLNTEVLPKVDADIVTLLGVLEYIYDVPALLRQIAQHHGAALVTYNALNLRPEHDRLADGWVNALNENELTAIIAWAGYSKINRLKQIGTQALYLIKK